MSAEESNQSEGDGHTLSEWNDLTVPQLKEELLGRGLETTGRKADLVARLEASDKELMEGLNTEPSNGVAQSAEEAENEFVVWNDGEGNEEQEVDNGEDEDEEEEEGADLTTQPSDTLIDEDDSAELLKLSESERHIKVKENEKEGAEAAAEKGPAKEEGVREEVNKVSDVEYGAEVSKSKDCLNVTWRHILINVPFKEEVLREMRYFSKKQNIIMYPIELSDVYSDVFRRQIEIATNVSMELDEMVPGAPCKGYLRLKFGSVVEAENAMDVIGEERKQSGREIKMRHFADNDSEGEILASVRRDDASKRDPISHRLLFVGNLANEVTEAALKDHFSAALRVYLPKKENSEDHRGYAFVEFRSEAEATQMLSEFRNTDLYGQTLFVIKSLTQKKESFGLLRDSLRSYWLTQLANLEATKAKATSANRTPREIAELDTKLLRLKRRIDKDNAVRESLCLPVPEDQKFGTTEADSDTKRETSTDPSQREGSEKRRSSPRPRSRYRSPPPRHRGSYPPYRGGGRGRGGPVGGGDASYLVNQLSELVGVLAHKVPERSDYRRGSDSYGGRPSYHDTRGGGYRGSAPRGRSSMTGGSRYSMMSGKRPHDDDYSSDRKRRYEEPDYRYERPSPRGGYRPPRRSRGGYGGY